MSAACAGLPEWALSGPADLLPAAWLQQQRPAKGNLSDRAPAPQVGFASQAPSGSGWLVLIPARGSLKLAQV